MNVTVYVTTSERGKVTVRTTPCKLRPGCTQVPVVLKPKAIAALRKKLK